MNTHRLIQIHNLLDNAESGVRSSLRAASNLARIGNLRGACHYEKRAARLQRLVWACRARLEAA